MNLRNDFSETGKCLLLALVFVTQTEGMACMPSERNNGPGRRGERMKIRTSEGLGRSGDQTLGPAGPAPAQQQLAVISGVTEHIRSTSLGV